MKKPNILLGQSLTMALSVAIAQIISFYWPADQSFWLPLTTFCVSLYISTPLTALRRTVHRILGSLYGVIMAGVVILIWPGLYQSLFFLTIFAGLTLWSRAFVSLYYLFVSFMTASVIMLLSILMKNTTLTPDYLITERIIFTLSGALISLICALIIMPPLESWDMLKTYRHYLTRFWLDYQKVIMTSDVSAPQPKEKLDQALLLKELHASSCAYAEKMPVWRWQLFFDRFIYRSLAKYLHRIYNMRILAGILLPGLDKFVARLPQTSPELVVHMEVKNLLKRNLNATKTIVQKLKNLKRPEATQALLELKKSNKELDELVLKHNISELKTAIIVLHELEFELEHLISGPVQHYLCLKKREHL